MPDDIDPQADAFLDGLMAERDAAVAKAREREIEEERKVMDDLDGKFVEMTDRPAPKSALFRAIEEKGELTDEDIHKLVAKEVRRGI